MRLHLAGENEAFGELCRRYRSRLVAFLTTKYGDKAFAEDVAHDALLRAMQRLDAFDTRRPFWPWLLTVATNIATDRFRRERRTLLEPEPEQRAVADHSDGVAERRVIGLALRELPPRQRQALLLKYIHGWGAEHASAHMGINRNAFDQLLYRARASLREAYLAIEPEAARRTRLVLWPGLVAVLRRIRASARTALDGPGAAHLLPSAAAAPLAAAGLVVLIQGGLVADPSARRIAFDAMEVDTRSASVTAEWSTGSRGLGQPNARAVAPRVSARGSDEPTGRDSTALRLTAETTSARDGDRYRQETTARAPRLGNSEVKRESTAACDDAVGRAMCDVEESAARVVQRATKSRPIPDDR